MTGATRHCLVGRDDELAVIGRVGARSASGEPSAVVVLGNAGEGKTTLIRHATDRLDAEVFRATCRQSSNGGFVSLRERIGLTQPMPVDQAASALRRSIVRRAQISPVAVVVDDVHWADAGTLSLLEQLLDAIEEADTGSLHLLLVMSTRPDHGSVRSRRVVDDPLLNRIVLRPFDEISVADFVEAATGSRPDPGHARTVLARTGGNPLHLCLWLDSSSSGPVTTGLYADRIRQLPHIERRLVACASVVGEPLGPVWLRVLMDGGGAPSPELLDGVMAQSGDGWWFSHPEAEREAYDMLTDDERTRWHGWVAERLLLDEKPSPSRSLRIERHYRHSTVPEPGLRLAVSLEAGQAALDEGLVEAAADAYRYAAEALLADRANCAPDAVDHLLRIGQAFALDNRPLEAHRLFWHAYGGASELGDAGRAGDALVRCIRSRLSWRTDSRTWPEVGLLREWVRAQPESPAVVEALITLADVAYVAEQYEEGAAWCERATAAAGPATRPSHCHALANYATGLQALGRLEASAALEGFRRAGSFADGLGDRVLDSWWKVRAAVAAHQAGDAAVRQAIASAISHTTDHSRWADAALAHGTAAAAAAAAGDEAALRTHSRMAFRYLRRTGYPAAADVAAPAIVFDHAVRGRSDDVASTLSEFREQGMRLPWWIDAAAGLQLGHPALVERALEERPPRPRRRPLSIGTIGTAAAVAALAAGGFVSPSADAARDLQFAAQRGLVWLPGWPMTTARAAGLALAALGERARADEWFVAGANEARRSGAWVELTLAHLDRVEFGGPGPTSGAAELIAALRRADSLGIGAAAARARCLLDQAPSLLSDPYCDLERTFLFTDIVGSTTLNVEVGDEVFVALLADHNEVVRTRTTESGGNVFHNTGDGYGTWFGTAAAAVATAAAIHDDLARRPVITADGRRIAVRIGIANGRALALERDLFGIDVVRTVRICSHAGAGETALDATTWSRLDARHQAKFDSARGVTLKGFPDTETLYVTRSGRSVPPAEKESHARPDALLPREGACLPADRVVRQREEEALEEGAREASTSGRGR